MKNNKPTIDGIILIDEFNERLTMLNKRADIDNVQKLTSELYRMFPTIVRKSELRTKLEHRI